MLRRDKENLKEDLFKMRSFMLLRDFFADGDTIHSHNARIILDLYDLSLPNKEGSFQ